MNLKEFFSNVRAKARQREIDKMREQNENNFNYIGSRADISEIDSMRIQRDAALKALESTMSEWTHASGRLEAQAKEIERLKGEKEALWEAIFHNRDKWRESRMQLERENAELRAEIEKLREIQRLMVLSHIKGGEINE